MHRTTRRTTLAGIAGVGGVCLFGCEAEPVDPPAASPPVVPFDMPACELDAVVDSFLAERVDAFPVLKGWLAAGTSSDTLHAAMLTVGARIVSTEDDMHAALVVNACYLLAKRIAPEDALVPLFYVCDAQLGAVVGAFDREPPPLPPFDAATVPSAADANGALLVAFEAWDAPAAEAAIVALHAAGGRDAVLGHLTRFGQRNQVWTGHTAIWTAYALRAMDALGWGCAPWVLRSLARAITANHDTSSTGAFASNLGRLADVPAGWRDGADEHASVPPLLAILRVGDADACVNAIFDELTKGRSPRTLWTALAVAAVELGIRYHEDSFGVHELDTLNALRHLQRLTPDPDTEVLALLQAAAWHTEFRASVEAKKTLEVDELLPSLAPTPGPAPTLPAIFDALSGDRVEAARMLVSFFDAGGSAQEVIDAWPAVVVKHASRDVHHYKYHLALLEETEAALPEWQRTLLLGITLRGPSTLDPAWARDAEARAILAELAGPT